MSATPSNANPRIPDEYSPSGAADSAQPRASYHAPGREALQALLAFSSLHDQIRRRRERAASRSRGFAGPVERFGPDEVLQLISERALAITRTDGVAIALAEDDQVFCRAAAGEIAPDVGVRLDPNSGFSGACLRTGLIVRCDDTDKDPRVDQAACRRIGVRSIVAVPLLTEQGVMGLIAAFCRDTHGVSDGDIRSLSLLAELALEALQPEDEVPSSNFRVIPGSDAAHETEATEQPSAGSDPYLETSDAETAHHETALPNLESLRSTLSLVTEERNTPPEERAVATEEHALPESERPHKSREPLVVVLILAFLALALAGVTLWWWRTKRLVGVSHPPTRNAASAVLPAAAPPQITEPAPDAAKDSAPRLITGIRHWSSADSSTLAIDLQEQVQYEAHRLSNPERIYFDLRDTGLAAGVPRNLEIGDAMLVRVRLAQPTSDLTRVVLETRSNADFSVKLENNPYRLLIEIHSASTKPKSGAKVDLFAPTSEGNAQSASSTTPERGTWLAPADTSTHPENAALAGAAHGLRIVLDAGHGGWDMGTVGRKGLLEKDLVLDIVARLGKLVTDRLGAEVIYTRRDDTYVALEKRTETANLSQADLFLSVHANYSDSPNARGVETYYTNTYSSAHARVPDGDSPDALNVDWMNVDVRDKVQQSRGFASSVQQALYHALAPKNPSLRNRGVKEASYVVLTGTTMPAILAEVSFVSSPEDETKLENSAYRQEIAEGLYKGIAAFAETRRVNVASASPRMGGQ